MAWYTHRKPLSSQYEARGLKNEWLCSQTLREPHGLAYVSSAPCRRSNTNSQYRAQTCEHLDIVHARTYELLYNSVAFQNPGKPAHTTQNPPLAPAGLQPCSCVGAVARHDTLSLCHSIPKGLRKCTLCSTLLPWQAAIRASMCGSWACDVSYMR